MDYYDIQDYPPNTGLFQGTPPTSCSLLSGAVPFQTSESEATVPDATNLLTSSVLIANSMDCLSRAGECQMEMETWPPVSCSTAPFGDSCFQPPTTLVTPPPELEMRGFPPLYTYPWQPAATYGAQHNPIPVSGPVAVTDHYLSGSSLEDSPLSSPGSSDGTSVQDTLQMLHNDATYGQPTISARSRSPLVDHVYGLTSTQSSGMMGTESLGYTALSTCSTSGYPASCSMVTVGDNRDSVNSTTNVPKGVKMPQRKGGIQLWQFLYSLLTDPEKKYCNIIEWTANIREREFRMLEPEAIAIWWGHHKNKPNMSYDKFSRSLRYYYDKGILKKIPGERYVYRFLTDPEQMYRHIGTSDSRPKLKPMPQSAKVAMTRYQKEQNLDFSSTNTPIVTQAPEPLAKTGDSSDSMLTLSTTSIHSTQTAPTPPPPYSYSTSSHTLQVRVAARYCSASTGNLATETEITGSSSGVVPMKRSRSLDSAYSEKSSSQPMSHSLPNNCYNSSRLSASPVSQSNGYSSSSIPTSQVEVGYGYDSYVANQMDTFSTSTDYSYALQQPASFAPPNSWN